MTTAGKSGVKYFCPSLGALCSSGTPRFLDLPAALTAIEVLLQMANKSADDSSARCPGSFAHIMVYHIKQRYCSLKRDIYYLLVLHQLLGEMMLCTLKNG